MTDDEAELVRAKPMPDPYTESSPSDVPWVAIPVIVGVLLVLIGIMFRSLVQTLF